MEEQTQRIEHLAVKLKAANDNPSSIKRNIKGFRTGNFITPIIQVESDFLRFRIDNSRTMLQHITYLRNHPELDDDFFSDPESEQVQKVQEEILLKLSNQKDFIEDLKGGQDDPNVITFDGYIVNGNRRTAALKLINTEWIDCLVLPADTTAREIFELEQEYQIAVDFKQDYHWINELNNIRVGLLNEKYKIKKDQMSRRLRISIQEIDRKLRRLELVDSFLIWKDISGQYDYSKIYDAEQIFKDLEQEVKKYSTNTENQKLLKHMVFTLIEEKPKEDRLYKWVKDLFKNFDGVKTQCKLGEEQFQPKKDENNNTGADIVDEIIGEDNKQKIEDIFQNPENAKENSENLAEVIADVRALTLEKDRAETVYEGVSRALRELQGLSANEEHIKLEATKNKLDEIIDKARTLLDQIDAIINKE